MHSHAAFAVLAFRQSVARLKRMLYVADGENIQSCLER